MHSFLFALLALPIPLGAQQPGARARDLGVAPGASARGRWHVPRDRQDDGILSRYKVNAR